MTTKMWRVERRRVDPEELVWASEDYTQITDRDMVKNYADVMLDDCQTGEVILIRPITEEEG